jgi:thiol:disulfide interchange protein
MKPSSITVLIFTTLLAGVAVVAEAQTPEIPAMPAARQSDQTELTWLTDLPKALVRAKAEGKSVLLFFHGSDWCPPCVEMQHQVFAAPEFIQYARRALILVDVNFPQKPRKAKH